MAASALSIVGISQRRSWRLERPRPLIRLALGVLGTTVLFGALAVGNSYAAYAPLVGSMLSTAPVVFGPEIDEQTARYVIVSSALALGYTFSVLAICVSFVHRLTGPMVALERHASALKSGHYGSRVTLRGGERLHIALARHLNDLAGQLEREERARRSDS
ncbi:MAG: hypothetical protein ACQGVK_15405 [Myxococcota bacterium]